VLGIEASSGEAKLLRGKELTSRLREDIAQSAHTLTLRGGALPLLVTILIGSNPSAEAYRASIVRTLRTVSIQHRALTLPAETTKSTLIETLHELNGDSQVTGILVLMPLPEHISPDTVLEYLSPLKDIDGITPTNAGRLHLGLPSLRPSTPQGGIELLDHYGIPIASARIAVIGRSNVVGRPLASLLTRRHATVTLCHRQTRDLSSITREADIVAVAAGHPGLITGDMLKAGSTVLDFGVNIVDGKVVGDADPESIGAVAAAYSPTPGGTGPVTALVLARNTIAAGYASLSGDLDHVVDVLPNSH